jgi:hypothetical protein
LVFGELALDGVDLLERLDRDGRALVAGVEGLTK